jgi:hypothetical protein
MKKLIKIILDVGNLLFEVFELFTNFSMMPFRSVLFTIQGVD